MSTFDPLKRQVQRAKEVDKAKGNETYIYTRARSRLDAKENFKRISEMLRQQMSKNKKEGKFGTY